MGNHTQDCMVIWGCLEIITEVLPERILLTTDDNLRLCLSISFNDPMWYGVATGIKLFWNCC
jgi:hypothetical protein